HAADAEFRQPRGDFFRIAVLGKIRAEGEVHAEKADAFGVLVRAGKKMAVARGDESMRTGGFFQPRGNIRHARRGIIPRQHEREERIVSPRVWFLKNREERKERADGNEEIRMTKPE